MFVYPPPIPNIESLSQPTISSLYSGSFGINRAGINIQQPNELEVADTETLLAYNKDIDPPPSQDISNVFTSADLLSHSSYDSAKYKRARQKAKVIHSSFLYTVECPDAFIRSLYIALNHNEIASIVALTGPFFQKKLQCNYPT